ncbi:hypothetical protein ACFTQ7_20785 [Lysinibacillus sp. NPDC056959]|uniref:hypothetical protein n=1 Tax=Lysinibacillus sp. NPDC056959 TaxID=3345981 RepID=UPI0036261A9D
MFSVRKRSVNAAAAKGFACAKAKRQQQLEVGHLVVATGCGVLRLSSSISAGDGHPQKEVKGMV